MLRLNTIRLLFFAVGLLPVTTTAAQNFRSMGQAWFRYYNQAQLKPKTSLHTEIDERINFRSPHQSQFFVHLHLHYRWKPWLDVAAGQNFNLTDSPVNPELEVPEIRPWQEVSLIAPTEGRWLTQFRYRLDQRFIHNNNRIELEEGFHFNLRHRFRLQAGTTLIGNPNDVKLGLRLSNELMLNTGDVPRTFDQNRIYCGLEVKLSNRWSLEGGYLNILQPGKEEDYIIRNVIRTTVYHRISL